MADLGSYDGVRAGDLAERAGVPHIRVFDVVDSTMDVAHDLARTGAAHGTSAIADTQRCGRGRERREWLSPRGGVWLTVILRDIRPGDLPLLPLRTGIAVAQSLDELAHQRIGLKWPNDLIVGEGKLGGVLVEARWRGDQPDWVAVGVGINTTVPEGVNAAALENSTRSMVAERVIRAVLDSAARGGELDELELAEYRSRDILRGEQIAAPVEGVVVGISAAGELLIDRNGTLCPVRSGSVVSVVLPRSLSTSR